MSDWASLASQIVGYGWATPPADAIQYRGGLIWTRIGGSKTSPTVDVLYKVRSTDIHNGFAKSVEEAKKEIDAMFAGPVLDLNNPSQILPTSGAVPVTYANAAPLPATPAGPLAVQAPQPLAVMAPNANVAKAPSRPPYAAYVTLAAMATLGAWWFLKHK